MAHPGAPKPAYGAAQALAVIITAAQAQQDKQEEA
jgi:hypothetical protein